MVKRLKKKSKPRDIPVVSEDRIATLCKLLDKNIRDESVRRRYAPIKHVLTFIGLAGVVGISLLSPGGASLGKLVLDSMRKNERKDARKYNPYYLDRALRRLRAQKYVDIADDGSIQTVTLTNLGRRRILKYSLDDLRIAAPKRWDGHWRLILYDVTDKKKHLRDVFRTTLKSLGFYKLQESTWIYPYPCEDQMTFLREYYDVGNEVLYAVVTKLEDDLPYREYFGLA